MTAGHELLQLQRWFAAVVEHPRTADVAIASRAVQQLIPRREVLAGRVVRDNPRMSAADMLQVYNGGYLARLVEVMASDYGALQQTVGEHVFEQLVQRYLQRHPSRHPNLNRLGRHFPAFVKRQRGLSDRRFLGDLADLELACALAFDAEEFAPLPADALASVPPDAWGDVHLTANPSLQLRTFAFPVGGHYQAWKEGRELPPTPAPSRSHMAVFRHDGRVWRQQLTAGGFRVLSALVAGEALGRALERAAAGDPVAQWFQDWAASGLFCALQLGS